LRSAPSSRSTASSESAPGDLRRALERPLAPLPPETATTLAAELERLRAVHALPLEVDWPSEVATPPDIEPLAQSVLAETMRNISKHAVPSVVRVAVARDEDTFTLEVRNDGARGGARGAGMGLRLAAFEALSHGGVVEFGPVGEDAWRVRLVVPLATEAAT
jgi:signal transduction histidine kinase